jgi:hypothetical protein
VYTSENLNACARVSIVFTEHFRSEARIAATPHEKMHGVRKPM